MKDKNAMKRSKGLCLWMAMAVVGAMTVVGCCKDDDVKVRDDVKQEESPDPEKPADNDTIPPLPQPSDTAVWGSGTADDPYRLRTCDEWNRLVSQYGNDPDAYFKVATELTLTNPIVCDTFRAHLDGNRCKVTLVNRSLFKVVSGGLIENVVLEGTVNQLNSDNLAGDRQGNGNNSYFGGIACVLEGGTIANCVSKVDYSLFSDKAIGLAHICGVLHSGTVDGCVVTSDIALNSNCNNFLGGIVAMLYADGVVMNCTFTGAIHTNSNSDFAGIVSVMFGGSVVNCCSHGVIQVENTNGNTGGIVSYCRNGVIDNCYFNGAVNGGFVSQICYRLNNAKMRFCYARQTDGQQFNDKSYNSTIESCSYLVNSTQLENVGYYGSNNVVDELNARAAVLEGASSWTYESSKVTIVR